MSEAVINWIGGPVFHAHTKGEFRLGEPFAGRTLGGNTRNETGVRLR